jgi:hypothetical protein
MWRTIYTDVWLRRRRWLRRINDRVCIFFKKRNGEENISRWVLIVIVSLWWPYDCWTDRNRTKRLEGDLLEAWTIINYKDTKRKCRHLKKFPVKGLCCRCLLKYIDWRQSVMVGIFDPALWTIAPLTFSLVQPPPPPPCVKVLYSSYRGEGASNR